MKHPKVMKYIIQLGPIKVMNYVVTKAFVNVHNDSSIVEVVYTTSSTLLKVCIVPFHTIAPLYN